MSRFTIAAALLVAITTGAGAQKPGAPKPTTEKSATTKAPSDAALRAAAKVSEDSARKIALKTVRGSTVKAIEIEEEKGIAIWSVDLVVAGKKGIEEVNIDSRTGKVVAKEHESDAAEKAEAAAEKTKPAPKKPAPVKP